jgi:hypothetical protein
VLSVKPQSVCRAKGRALAASNTFARRTTYFFAGRTSYALALKESHLGVRALPLGIMTPEAVKIAPLEKHDRAKPRSVKGRGTLYIKNQRFIHNHL